MGDASDIPTLGTLRDDAPVEQEEQQGRWVGGVRTEDEP